MLFVIHSGVFVQAHLHLAVAVLLAHVVAEVVEAQGAILGGDDTVGEVVWAAAIVEPPADIQLRGGAAVVGDRRSAATVALMAAEAVPPVVLPARTRPPFVVVFETLAVVLLLVAVASPPTPAVVLLGGGAGVRVCLGAVLPGALPAVPQSLQLGGVKERGLLDPEAGIHLEDVVNEAGEDGRLLQAIELPFHEALGLEEAMQDLEGEIPGHCQAGGQNQVAECSLQLHHVCQLFPALMDGDSVFAGQRHGPGACGAVADVGDGEELQR